MNQIPTDILTKLGQTDIAKLSEITKKEESLVSETIVSDNIMDNDFDKQSLKFKRNKLNKKSKKRKRTLSTQNGNNQKPKLKFKKHDKATSTSIGFYRQNSIHPQYPCWSSGRMTITIIIGQKQMKASLICNLSFKVLSLCEIDIKNM